MGQSWSTQENEVENEEVTQRRDRMENQSIQPKRLRNARVTILDEILVHKAKLHDALVTENKAILLQFLDSFIVEMKSKDKLFELLFRRIYYTGSFFAGLRVSKPDEFDLNLVLKMPKLHTVTYHAQVPSYAKYQITDEKCIAKEPALAKLFEKGYLIPNKVRIWIQSVVDKALKTYRPPPCISRIKCSAAGPARTVKLIKKNGDLIDIDLVPAIECSLGLKPPGINGLVYEKVKDNIQCFLIPKPYQPTRQAPINEAERLLLWRTHYPEAEKNLMHDLGCVKSIIKLLKLLRDKEDWKILASYYLKTIVMWMILENSSKEFWRQDNMGERFVEALRRLATCVKEKKISYFFSSRYNLVEKISVAQADNLYNRLCAIIKDIEKDDQKLWAIFGCKQTFTM